MSLLITVGTTKFESLIKEVSQPAFLDLALSKFPKIVIQYGQGPEPPISNPQVTLISLSKEFDLLLDDASLVITACGAGTLIECFARQKPLIMVVNESLDGNHQNELAEKVLSLTEQNLNIRKSTPETILETLKTCLSKDIKSSKFEPASDDKDEVLELIDSLI